MFIEWIDNNVKKEYLEQYIAAYNKGKPGKEKLQEFDVFAEAGAYNIDGFEDFVRSMEYDNNYVRFYTSHIFDGQKVRQVFETLVFCFGDTSCDIHKYVYTNTSLKDLPSKMLADLQKNEYMYSYRSDDLNQYYVKKFIMPNILPQQKIDFIKHVRTLQAQQKDALNKKHDRQWEQMFGK